MERLWEKNVLQAFGSFDQIYQQPNGASPLAELANRLSAALPKDRAEVDLEDYRGLQPPWNDWKHLAALGRKWGKVMARIILDQKS